MIAFDLLANSSSDIDAFVLVGGMIGGLAIFLLGMDQMTESLKLVAGERLRGLLLRLTKNRFAGLLSGAGLTAVVQSSSVTTVMVVGFISSGLMTFSQSIGVILGANIGTTITAQIVAFKVTKAAMLMVAVGFWRFLTAEIGTKFRYTLYYHLEKICGKRLVTVYNLANGILFCFLAGAMITVSATAVGVPFNMEMPKLTDTMPNSATWVIIVLAIGAVISIIAAKGYSTVAKAANWMSPIIVLAFVICGVVSLVNLDVHSFSDFWNIWGEGSEPFPGQIKYTFWHVFLWSWFANAAMHIVFRYCSEGLLVYR